MSEATRAYIYRVVGALASVATAYGLIADEKVPVILAAVAAILSVGLAVRNTSTTPPPPDDPGA